MALPSILKTRYITFEDWDGNITDPKSGSQSDCVIAITDSVYLLREKLVAGGVMGDEAITPVLIVSTTNDLGVDDTRILASQGRTWPIAIDIVTPEGGPTAINSGVRSVLREAAYRKLVA